MVKFVDLEDAGIDAEFVDAPDADDREYKNGDRVSYVFASGKTVFGVFTHYYHDGQPCVLFDGHGAWLSVDEKRLSKVVE